MRFFDVDGGPISASIDDEGHLMFTDVIDHLDDRQYRVIAAFEISVAQPEGILA